MSWGYDAYIAGGPYVDVFDVVLAEIQQRLHDALHHFRVLQPWPAGKPPFSLQSKATKPIVPLVLYSKRSPY